MSEERRFRLYQVKAFTRSPFSGNPAGVVPTAEGLSESEMQAIVRELGNPESAFVLPADGDDHDVRVRFFTPSTEVPSCGHATVAAHYGRALELELAGGVRVLQKIGAGILAVEIEEEEDGDYLVVMTQAPPRFGTSLDGARLAEPGDDVLTRARMFAPEIGIPEDPVTGNGNGPLGAYLGRHCVVAHDGASLHFRSRQGEAMGRPGVARVWVDIEGEAPTRVRVGGNAVVVLRGELILPNPR